MLVALIPVATGVVLHDRGIAVELVPVKQVSGPLDVPSPSSPVSLSPQQSTEPEVRTAQ